MYYCAIFSSTFYIAKVLTSFNGDQLNVYQFIRIYTHVYVKLQINVMIMMDKTGWILHIFVYDLNGFIFWMQSIAKRNKETLSFCLFNVQYLSNDLSVFLSLYNLYWASSLTKRPVLIKNHHIIISYQIEVDMSSS